MTARSLKEGSLVASRAFASSSSAGVLLYSLVLAEAGDASSDSLLTCFVSYST